MARRSKYFYQAFIYNVEHNSFEHLPEVIWGDKAGITGFSNVQYKKAYNAAIQSVHEIMKISKEFYPKWYKACEEGVEFEKRERILERESKENGKKFRERLERIANWYKEKLEK